MTSFVFVNGVNGIRKKIAALMLLYYTKETIINSLNSYMRAGHRSFILSGSVLKDKTIPRTLLRSYPEAVNYRLQKFVTHKVAAECDIVTLRYMQPANLTLQPFADALIVSS